MAIAGISTRPARAYMKQFKSNGEWSELVLLKCLKWPCEKETCGNKMEIVLERTIKLRESLKLGRNCPNTSQESENTLHKQHEENGVLLIQRPYMRDSIGFPH